MANAGIKIKNTINIKKLLKKSKSGFSGAQSKAAIEMLKWMSKGSSTEQAAPPIRTGVLASSGSAFYKNRNLAISPDIANGQGTPVKNFKAKNISWIFNTSYATRMHEDKNLNPGPFSERSPNRKPGNEWMRKHLKNDKDLYTALIAKFMKKVF